MIIVDCATFNAMNRDYARWCHLYSEPDGKTEITNAVNALLESLGTIINECQIDNDNDISQWECDE